MQKEFVPARIESLRRNHGVSARQMSLAIGQNPNYINHVEIGKAQPSMAIFFRICDYFGITPQAFFDEEETNPERIATLMNDIKRMDSESIKVLSELVKRIVR